MRPETLLLIGSFIALAAMRVPISFALGISSLITLLVIGVDPVVTAQLIFAGMDKDSLMAIPFFVLAGAIMSQGGMARKMVDLASLAVGWMPGGLAVVNILSSMFFGAISGSAVAATSAVGSTLIPSMVEKGADRGYATSVTITGATQGLLIPPSHNAIIYSLAAGGVASIEALFIAGIVPGMLVGFSLMAVAVGIAVKRGYPRDSDLPLKTAVAEFIGVTAAIAVALFALHRDLINLPLFGLLVLAVSGILVLRIYKRRGGSGVKKVFTVIRDAVLPIISPIIIVGGIMFGWFTAIESSVIAVVWAIVVNFVIFAWLFKDTSLREYPAVAVQAMKVIVMVMWLIGNATAFGYCLTRLHVPEAATGALLAITDNPYVLLLLINLMLLALGTIMDMAPLIIITTPILLPVAGKIGVDPVHFGIIMIANLGLGLCTPPVGSALFVGCAVGKTRIETVTRNVWPFYLAMFAVILLITYAPFLSMGLVNLYLGR
jgi:TRAP-type C4-dicarboxylate transport system permease large subunit